MRKISVGGDLFDLENKNEIGGVAMIVIKQKRGRKINSPKRKDTDRVILYKFLHLMTSLLRREGETSLHLEISKLVR